jgi:phosphate:Na+ symporter
VVIPEGLIPLLGGVGMFLYGMHQLTSDLRLIASDKARGALRRFAGRPVPGFFAGAAVTALVQSSSATMVMTLGFVGAGFLTLTQSLGIILGANVGTTLTGWAVMLLGVKVSLGAVAFPALFLAALVRILARGALARFAGVLAGLALILIGIDLMKAGMEGAQDFLGPDALPADTLQGRLLLLGLGAAVTLVTQSSSAGVAAAIVLLAGGHASFTQAAALVVGMSVGTTFTGILASLGGTTDMRRAALAHLVFNLTQGLVALVLLDAVARILPDDPGDGPLALVMFHTAFTLAGALVFLPVLDRVAALVSRLVPERPAALAQELDRRFLPDPSAALDMALAATRRRVVGVFGHLGELLRPAGGRPAPFDPANLTAEAEGIGQYVTQIPVPDKDQARLDRVGDLLAVLDHLRRLAHRVGQGGRITVAQYDPALRREARLFGAVLRAAGVAAASPADPARAAQLARAHLRLDRAVARLDRRESALRRRVLAAHATPPRLFAVTDAMRWLRRSVAHAERVLHHLQAAEGQAQPQTGDQAR